LLKEEKTQQALRK
jgi:hypothetical protein